MVVSPTRRRREWESVSLQTSWKLEPCSKPARPEKSTEHTGSTDLGAPTEQTDDAAAAPTTGDSQSGTVIVPSSDHPDPESAPGSEDNAGELDGNSQNPNPTNESDNFLLVEGLGESQT